MEWLEASVYTHTESVEAVSEWFIQAGSKGVSIEDPSDFEQLNEEQLEWLKVNKKELFTTDDVIVRAYFPVEQWTDTLEQATREKLLELKSSGLSVGKNSLHITTVGEEDWADAWKKYYFPVRVTRYLTIVPSWLNYEKEQADEKLIVLDPGLAFGTGTHPTTQLSLVALEQTMRGNETVLDVGTGSGVLSIAAHYLGAKQVFAYDIDEVATRVSKENIALNHLEQDIVVSENNLLVGVEQEADIIVANILAEILVHMPQDAYRLLKKEGKLILSGVIESKKSFVVEAYQAAGFVLVEHLQMGEWNGLIFQKSEEA